MKMRTQLGRRHDDMERRKEGIFPASRRFPSSISNIVGISADYKTNASPLESWRRLRTHAQSSTPCHRSSLRACTLFVTSPLVSFFSFFFFPFRFVESQWLATVTKFLNKPPRVPEEEFQTGRVTFFCSNCRCRRRKGGDVMFMFVVGKGGGKRSGLSV